MLWLYCQNKYYVLKLQNAINLICCYFNNNNKLIRFLLKIVFLKCTLKVFLDSTKLKIDCRKITTFFNDAFQSYYDLFQVN